MISTPMSWIRQLEQFVPPGSLTKGRNYFRSGAVEIHEASADRVEATVKGGGRYWVALDLDVDLQAVVASCTCPHYDDGNLCKHIWARHEAAEAEGQLGQIVEMGDGKCPNCTSLISRCLRFSRDQQKYTAITPLTPHANRIPFDPGIGYLPALKICWYLCCAKRGDFS